MGGDCPEAGVAVNRKLFRNCEGKELSGVERDILLQVAHGEGGKAIAGGRGISVGHLYLRLHLIRRKLGANDLPHAVYLAMKGHVFDGREGD